MTFINKLDREGRAPIELLDEIESVLKIQSAPVTWPIGMGRELRGIYHLLEDRIYVYEAGERGRAGGNRVIDGLDSADARELLGERAGGLSRRDRAGARRRPGLRSGRLSRRPADAGVLRLGDRQLRRRGAAGRLRRRTRRRRCRAPRAQRMVEPDEPS